MVIHILAVVLRLAEPTSLAEDIKPWETSVAELPVDPAEVVVEPPGDMRLVLLMGQSNMAGRAPVSESERTPLPRTYKLNRDGRWVRATSPIHFDRKSSGIGPANAFVREYLKDHPGDTVGLVPCAVGGSGMATWTADGSGTSGANLRWALERAKIAQSNGVYIAMLWHQGETDGVRTNGAQCVAAYPRRFLGMVERVRRELRTPDLPVVIGEIGSFWNDVVKGVRAADLVNPMLRSLPASVPRCRCVSSAGLTPWTDGMHFDLPSVTELGRRYHEAYKRLITPVSWMPPCPVAPPAAALTNEALYLKWKWRSDATDPETGLSNCELQPRLWKRMDEMKGKVHWREVKADLFRCLCENMSIGVSEYDWFPAFAAWDRHLRPLAKIVRARQTEILSARHADLVAEVDRIGNGMYPDMDHSAADWDAILKLGFPGLRRRLYAYWKDDAYHRSLDVTADAISGCVARLAKFARSESARHPESVRLAREAETLERLCTDAPQTAYDAMQFIYLYWVFSEHFDFCQCRSLGNLDRLLQPYYAADLAAGRTTETEFRDQMRHFLWQWGSIDNYWGQPVYLGGTKRDGTSEYCEVSRIILDVADRENLPSPKFQLKIARNTPQDVLDKALDMIRRHRSIVFMGEESIFRILKHYGHTDDEARDSEIFGCYEFRSRGVENTTGSGVVVALKLLSDMLEDARCGRYDAATFEAFRNELLRRIRADFDSVIRVCNEWEGSVPDINPANVFTLTVESAISRGRDALFNGMKYNNCTTHLACIGTTVDALMAIREIVYERKEMTLAELGQLMADDWKGNDDLRLRMVNSCRKWGNGDAETDTLAAWLLHAIGDHVNGRPNGRGGIHLLSPHTGRSFLIEGARLRATPDGRRAGEETSKNLSPSTGSDREGVTALVKSLAVLDSRRFPGDFPLDVMLLPNAVAGEKGLETLRTLLSVYFDNGGVQIHFNIVDAEMLRDAQRHPESYENLQIRVCGWNVRWNDMPKVEQDAYIRRAEEIAR